MILNRCYYKISIKCDFKSAIKDRFFLLRFPVCSVILLNLCKIKISSHQNGWTRGYTFNNKKLFPSLLVKI